MPTEPSDLASQGQGTGAAHELERATVAVIAHAGKSLGGGLPALREALGNAGFASPIWFEVDKSKKAPKKVRQARQDGADLVFVWGGDGMVQQCINALAGSGTTLAIVPAGTANLLATNLGIPKDLDAAVDVGVHGARRRIDTGTVNDEHFAVMAGAGFDALMIRDAPRKMKDRVGKLAYLWTGARNLGASRVKMRIKVDGVKWFDGKASCVLVGNVGKILGGVTAFEDAEPDDGILELGVVTASGVWQWTRALARTAAGNAERSPFVSTTRGTKFDIRIRDPWPYELDGGARKPVKRLRVKAVPASIIVAVPDTTTA
jgi:YegS/Rv2252/BmrU family lipid kinase